MTVIATIAAGVIEAVIATILYEWMKRYTGKVSLGHMFSENDRYTKLNPNNKGTITDITELPKGMAGSRFALVIILIVFLSLAVNMQSSNNNNIVLGQTNHATNQDSSSFLAKAVTINNNNTLV